MPDAGNIKDGDVAVIGPELIRIDLTASDSQAHKEGGRISAVLDLKTARAMAILLIRAIEKAEVDAARGSKPKGKKK